METKKLKVKRVELYYMSKVDNDGNNYRFYVADGLVSNIEYFCTDKTGNMEVIVEGVAIQIVPSKINYIPVKTYRELQSEWNRLLFHGGWDRLEVFLKLKPDTCIIKNAGLDVNGNVKSSLYLFKGTKNVTRFFNRWRLSKDRNRMTTNEYKSEIIRCLKDKFGEIKILEI